MAEFTHIGNINYFTFNQNDVIEIVDQIFNHCTYLPWSETITTFNNVADSDGKTTLRPSTPVSSNIDANLNTAISNMLYGSFEKEQLESFLHRRYRRALYNSIRKTFAAKLKGYRQCKTLDEAINSIGEEYLRQDDMLILTSVLTPKFDENGLYKGIKVRYSNGFNLKADEFIVVHTPSVFIQMNNNNKGICINRETMADQYATLFTAKDSYRIGMLDNFAFATV